MDPATPMIVIDALQYTNWSEKIFRQMREGGVAAVHATICYHENFRETVANMAAWSRRFERHADLIFPGRSAANVLKAEAQGRTTSARMSAFNASCRCRSGGQAGEDQVFQIGPEG